MHLGSMPIELWDESRLAINAIEMQKSGNLIVTTYLGEPDMWNTKPPLMIWCQVFFLNIIGPAELAIRLPAAIAAFITIMLVFWFCYRYLKSVVFGFIAAIVLVSSPGYISMHVARTGDYDALLVLFLTLYTLAFFTYLHTKNIKYLYLFFTAIPLAILTKSVAGLFLLPGCLLFLLFQKALVPLLRNKHTYIGLTITILPVVLYYLLREAYNPGYWEAVQMNELGGRYAAQEDVNKSTFWFYWNQIIETRFNYFHLLIPCGLLVGLASKESRLKKLSVFLLCMIIPFFLIISSAKTRLLWYDAPLYPFFAIAIAILGYSIYKILGNDNLKKSFSDSFNALGITFLFLLLVTPYSQSVSSSYKPMQQVHPNTYDAYYRASELFKKGLKGEVNLEDHQFLHYGYNAHQEFYIQRLQDKGVNIKEIEHQPIKVGYKVIIDQAQFDTLLQTDYQLDTLYKEQNLKIYHILGKK